MVQKLSVGYDKYLMCVTRVQWNARKAEGVIRDMHQPISYARMVDTGTLPCRGNDCVSLVQRLQNQSIEKGLPDIPFSFLVDSDGIVYRARGWHKRAERYPYNEWINDKCIEIAFIGNFLDGKPPFNMMVTALDIIKYGVKNNLVDPFFKLLEFKHGVHGL